jgi:hypothetical protein
MLNVVEPVRAVATSTVLTATAVWLGVAVAVGESGLLRGARPPLPQVVLLGLTVALLGLLRVSPGFRAWAFAVDVRGLTLIHATRFVGAYFLVLHARGELPWAFAVPGGWGDIVVAVAALALAGLAPRRGPAGWWAYAIWNVVGFADIVGVVLTAVRLALADPASMQALLRLPLSLLPTYLVPIIAWSHLVIFARLAASRRAGYPTL